METIANERAFEQLHAANIMPVASVAMTLDQIEAARNAAEAIYKEAEARLKEAIARDRSSVIARVQADIHRYGITKEEVKLAPLVSVPKYRDSVSLATWSGKGNAPSWANGKHLDQFLNPAWVAKNAAKAA